MSQRKLLGGLACAIAAVAIFPAVAHAWTPGTHIFLGESVLANLAVLPGWVAELLRSFPYDFLYGSIAADTSIAKKYAPVGRHCHSWKVGREIYELATTEPLKAFGLGYLAHLAADSVAHNHFVPRQLVITSRTIALGHSWWESRFEAHLGNHYARTAKDLIRQDHGTSDGHLDEILSPTIFSVRTGRRIFRGMVGLTETQSWQTVFRAVAEASRWDLREDDIDAQMEVSFNLIIDLLRNMNGALSTAERLDPSGESSLHLAKTIRLDVLKGAISTDIGKLTNIADEHFALPEYPHSFWQDLSVSRPWNAHTNAEQA